MPFGVAVCDRLNNTQLASAALAWHNGAIVATNSQTIVFTSLECEDTTQPVRELSGVFNLFSVNVYLNDLCVEYFPDLSGLPYVIQPVVTLGAVGLCPQPRTSYQFIFGANGTELLLQYGFDELPSTGTSLTWLVQNTGSTRV